jgi:hypothetical protein
MRVNVDESAKSDPRFRRLARLMNWHVDWAIGAVTQLWMVSCNRVWAEHPHNPRGLMSRDDLEDATDHRGLVDAMLQAGLAVELEGKLYLAGLEDAASWIGGKRGSNQRGGHARAAQAARGPDGTFLPSERPVPAASRSPGDAGPASPSGLEEGDQEAGPANQRSSLLFSSLSLSPPGLDFGAVYALYPRKDGRKKGIAKLERVVTKPGDYEALLRAVKNYAASRQGQDPKFTKHFSTWAGEWEDWVEVAEVIPIRGDANEEDAWLARLAREHGLPGGPK